ncbi:glycosyltransferase family 4 protein [Limimaricola cinnabarinus]|jgi:glycosyltransferase involved in cell wall biosynthesis|uniref:Colanic acid biosynthesis glycosyltransferase WcaL n=1 Tax=Limimaricola cinnabarinus TaxID=1125964 RepID=A0A2G1MGA6_9RHOB|nr:glycosyltransferase family 4 protein [Limimaricola cinnabarinus]PHP27776.1 colanic acid biosynthesis glycosyltransferase WcaL [Limimaricola cinnabarinus]
MSAPGPVIWLTGEYPRATDTFIQREVAALRDLGITVETASVRRTDPAHHVGPEQRAEAAATFHLLERALNPVAITRAKLSALCRPARFWRALALAWRSAPKGLRGRLYNMIYFGEALVLAQRMQARGITHLHNHIAKSSGTVAMLASEISGIPYSFTLHGPDIFFAPEQWALGEKIARARFVACISDFARSQAMLFSDPAHWHKLHVVHCGVAPELYADTPAPPDDRLLFVGRLSAVKGVPVLLRALARARETRPALTLDLVGDGEDRAALERLAADLGLGDAVRFHGYLGQAEVARMLRETGALVLPSFAEGVPVVLMEAMAAARPVIATRVGGVAELVEHGVSGLLVPPGAEAPLAEAMLALAGDPTRRAAMGAEGRAAVMAGFDARHEAARMLRLLRDGPSGPGGPVRPEPAA